MMNTESMLGGDDIGEFCICACKHMRVKVNSLQARLDALTGLDALSTALDKAQGADDLNNRAEAAEARVQELEQEREQRVLQAHAAGYASAGFDREAAEARVQELERKLDEIILALGQAAVLEKRNEELEREVARLKELIEKVRSGSKLAANLIDTLR